MLTPATITVTFTANYSGPHRICWRVQGSLGPYVCTNIVNCAGGGNVCQAVVSIMVDPESCDPVTYEGYIQATCNPEGSSVDQIPWSITFTPNPVCTPYLLTCNGGPCPPISSDDMGLDCNGAIRPSVGPLDGGKSIMLCSLGVIANLPPEYSMAPTDACCYDCTLYTVTASPNCPVGCTLDGSSIYYVDCNTRELKRIDLTGTNDYTNNICAVTGSVTLQLNGETTATVTPVGPCP